MAVLIMKALLVPIKVASDLHRRGFINDLKAGLSRSMAAIEAAQATAQKGQEKEE